MASDSVIEQLEAIETLLPVSFAIEETAAGNIVFDMHTPHGVVVKRRPGR